ncbi:uncharacterized protein [Musca autumnalis]|uniref:uncharacterized protein n=1 Tax=Musca autumnalis TaxID=221902 RepID=UPI003CF01092
MGRSTIGEIVLETCEALNTVLKGFIKIPTSADEWRSTALHFGKKWNFFHCLGSIDGKHVAIRKPANSGSMYYNYKMAVVNSNYEFIMVDVGSNGRVSDGGVMFYTSFWQRFLNGQLNLPPPQPLPGIQSETPYVFIADDAFPLSTNLVPVHTRVNFIKKFHEIRPYSSTNLTKEQQIFNYRLSRARRVVENTFGVLAARFGDFQKPMLLEPKKAAIVTLTCCYLHNFLIKHNKKEYASRSVMEYENVATGNIQRGQNFKNSHLMSLQTA